MYKRYDETKKVLFWYPSQLGYKWVNNTTNTSLLIWNDIDLYTTVYFLFGVVDESILFYILTTVNLYFEWLSFCYSNINLLNIDLKR